MKVQVKENPLKRKINFPPLGLRIKKTGIAVFLCLLVYILRGYRGMVSQSCVAAIICMQPFRNESIEQALNRILGTLVGAGWGLLFLQLLDWYPVLSVSMLVVYFLMAIGVVITLYSTVLIRQTNASGLAAIVFICIVVGYPELEAPFVQTFDRVVDTIIGIVIAAFVNTYSRPRKKHPEYIFFVRLQDLVPDRYSHVSSMILVLLNRLYNDGARISLVSRWAPAFLLSQMGTMNINLPVIVMAGAAMYDIPNKQYMNVISISREQAEEVDHLITRMNRGYCIYTVQESNMFVYQRGIMNRMEQEDYELMKRSPYRNYVSGELAEEDQIAFIRMIDFDEAINELEIFIQNKLPEGIRMERRKQPRMEGCSGLYLFHENATIEKQKYNLMEYLKEHGEHGIVPVDMISQDSYRSEREAIHLLNKLQDIYEPVTHI